MLGMVFTELVEMVEHKFSPEVADDMMDAAQAAGGGVYTAVGSYPVDQIGVMVNRVSEVTKVPAPDLIREFGRHLLERFAQSHPGHFQRHPDVFDFLAAVDSEIHVEVKKLYSNATLPRFRVVSRTESVMHLRYDSPRRMELLALGLIEQLGEYAGQPLSTTCEPDEAGCLFIVRKVRP